MLIKSLFSPFYLHGMNRKSYLCCVFFMVLDLRLIKIDCRETINFFCIYLKIIIFLLSHFFLSIVFSQH
jgi:hypothetical protein